MLPPILFIAFNRPQHTRQSMEALLAQNPEEIYVFGDGPREGNDNDIVKCKRVRETVEEMAKTSLCKFHYHWSETNQGCRDAVIFAISSVLKEHDTVIVVEDDVITSSAFLAYMYEALDYYRDRKTVFSISGFSYAPDKFTIKEDYSYDVYASPRLFNWGWATWRDRWIQCDWTMSYYPDLMKHPEEITAFCRGGEDMIDLLTAEKNGMSSAWDIQFAFCHFMNHAVSIVPCKSYTYNIGEDGSGTHCYDKGKEYNENLPSCLNQNSNPRFLNNLYFDSDIINSQHSIFYSNRLPWGQKLINYIIWILNPDHVFHNRKKIFL